MAEQTTQTQEGVQQQQAVDPNVAAENLLNQMHQPAQQQNNLPEGFDPTKFNQTLQQVAGIEDYTQIPNVLQERDKYQKQYLDMTQKYNALEAKQNMNPYANDLVKTIDQFFRENRSPQEINRFLALHSQDINSMSPMDLAVQKMTMEMPGMSAEDARLIIEDDLEDIPILGEDPTEADKRKVERAQQKRKAQMMKLGHEAKKFLIDQRKSFDNPQLAQMQAQRQQQIQQVNQAWNRVNSGILDEDVKMGYTVKGKDGNDYYSHPGFSPKLEPQQKQQLTQLLTDYAIQNNLPFDQASLPQIMEYRDTLLRTMFFEEYMGSIIRDYDAFVRQELIKEYAGGGQSQGQVGQPTQPPAAQRNPMAPQQKPASKFPEAKRGDQFF